MSATVWRWGAVAFVMVVAALTRLWNLGHPHELVFDETYYVKDAWTLLNLGYEARWDAEPDLLFETGTTDHYLTQGSFVVHPPLGKWVIALGLAVFGADNPIGWRIGTAVTGILLVALVMVVGWVLTRSTLVATIAGYLIAIDGHAIVMSRVALLDGILAFFVLLGVLFVILDRPHSRARLERWLALRRDRSTDWGPALWWRPWLIAAGAAFGAAAAVKWNGLYYLAAFAVYTIVVDALARRRAGITFWLSGTVLKQGPASFLLTVPIAAAVYVTSWTGWFATEGGYYRQWATRDDNAWEGAFAWVPLDAQSWWQYQVSAYNYHVGASTPHGWQANPLTWLLLIRPTMMYYRGTDQGVDGCGAQRCAEVIHDLPNPLIWWAAVAALVYLVVRLIRRREWQVGVLALGVAAGYLPWLLYLERTVFQFYTIVFLPYLYLGLAVALQAIRGRPDDPPDRRLAGAGVVAVALVLMTLLSVFFWPMWTAIQTSTDFTRLHYWLPTWR